MNGGKKKPCPELTSVWKYFRRKLFAKRYPNALSFEYIYLLVTALRDGTVRVRAPLRAEKKKKKEKSHTFRFRDENNTISREFNEDPFSRLCY